MSDEFSVVLYFPTGDYFYERRDLDAEAAVRFAKECTERPAMTAGLVPRVIIVDAEDNTVFEWQHGRGVTFPPMKGADKMTRCRWCGQTGGHSIDCGMPIAT